MFALPHDRDMIRDQRHNDGDEFQITLTLT